MMEKKNAVQAITLWNGMWESSGIYCCMEKSFSFVKRFLDMVSNNKQYPNDKEAADPLVNAMPTPIMWRRSVCSAKNE